MIRLKAFKNSEYASYQTTIRTQLVSILYRMIQPHIPRPVVKLWADIITEEFEIDHNASSNIAIMLNRTCGRPGCDGEKEVVSKCSKCKSVKYCSAECQKQCVLVSFFCD